MILYHFTSKTQLAGIDRDGLTKGMVPWQIKRDRTVTKMGHLQWLTSEPNFEAQTWEKMVGFPANLLVWKTQVRLAIDIPALARFKCVEWPQFAARHNLGFGEYAKTFPGHRSWYIYAGCIPRNWIVSVDYNPEKRNLQEIEQNGSN